MKRLVAKELVEKAYSLEDYSQTRLDKKVEGFKEKTEKLPREIFEIVGDLVNFIEKVNKMEGKK